MALIAAWTARDAWARPSDAREALSALLVLGKQLGLSLPTGGERYAYTRPARAPDVLARRALTLPFVPYGGAVEALVAALESHELVLLRGPHGSGRTRLALEALRSLNERRVARDAPPFTWLRGLAPLAALEAARVLVLVDDAGQEDCDEAARAIRAARLAGRTVRVLLVGDATLRSDGARLLELPQLSASELGSLAERLFDR
jgi:hypothetical protein